MKNLSRLSVIIPSLNEEENLARAVARAWQLGPLEVLVCDGGSNDRSEEVAREHGATVLKSRPGRGVQLGVGAAAAHGDSFLFLHADSWLDPSAKEQLIEALQDNGIVWGAFRQAIDERGSLYRALEWGNAFRAKSIKLPFGDQGMFVRREAYFKVGGFPDHPLMEDADLSRRLRRLANPVLLEGPLHVSARRWRRHGVVRQTAKNWAFLAMWRLGVPPARLARWYRSHAAGANPAASAPAADPPSSNREESTPAALRQSLVPPCETEE